MTQAQRKAISPALPKALFEATLATLHAQGPALTTPQIDSLLKKYPDAADAHLLKGIALHATGKFNEAIAFYNQTLLIDPANTQALYQLARIMKATDQNEQYIDLLEALLQHDPTHTQTLYDLRDAYLQAKDNNNLVRTAVMSVMAAPENSPSWSWMRKVLQQIPHLQLPDAFLVFVYQHAQQLNIMDYGKAAVAGFLCLRSDPRYAEWGSVFGHKKADLPQYSLTEVLERLDYPLLSPVLARGLVGLHDFETYIRILRYTLLKAWHEETLPTTLPLAVMQSLAIYFFRVEFLPDVTAEEELWLKSLWETLAAEEGEKVTELLLYACYHPFTALPNIAYWNAEYAEHPMLQQLLHMSYAEPMQEQDIRATIPRLSDISDHISAAVQEQYEENPYPRWDYLPETPAMKWADYFRAHLSMQPKVPVRYKDDVQMLIAGCGTGMQTAGAASRFPRAKILNIDLSATSIAYAKRKATELKVDKNLEFIQADILELGKLGRQFDIIECVGVLHHMADPMSGWKVLNSLLKPGGAMRIGLYSKIARKDIITAREEIASRGLQDTLEDMRRYRREATRHNQYIFVNSSDFFTTSNVRDLLFHRSEKQFTIPQIQECLKELGLQFMGFTQNGVIHRWFDDCFPYSRDYDDLEKWRITEEEHPALFFGMYQFWCYKPK